MRFRGPLADNYPSAVALVVFSLIPYLALTAGIFPLLPVISKSTGLSMHDLDVTIAVSTGAYAVGTVLAVQLAVHLPARRLLIAYELGFVLSSILAAWAPTGYVFIGAFIAQGLFTSLMLIAAVPPLVVSWPAKKMPLTGTIMNLCIFGAVAVGPTLGAAELLGKAWRPFFWGVAGLAGLALCFSLLTFEDDPPQDKSAPWDGLAVSLAVAGCGAAFFGAGELQAVGSPGLVSLVPLIAGTVLIVALVAYQFGRAEPLMPVRAAASTVPVTGIFIALMASAAGFGIMELLMVSLEKSSTPASSALIFLPEFIGAVLVAGLFGLLFRTRYTPLLALGGLVAIAASAGLAIALLPTSSGLLGLVTGLLGLGVGASVSPALFMVGFSLRSKMLQRVFAMIELMRGVTAFLVAPILVFLASTLSKSQLLGTKDSLWICLGLAGFGFFGGTALYLSGRPWLEAPNIDSWQEEGELAWAAPRLFDRLRRPEEAETPEREEQAA